MPLSDSVAHASGLNIVIVREAGSSKLLCILDPDISTEGVLLARRINPQSRHRTIEWTDGRGGSLTVPYICIWIRD